MTPAAGATAQGTTAVTQTASDVAERVHREGGYDSELLIDAEGTGEGVVGNKAPREPRSSRNRGGGGGSPTLAYLILGAVLATLVVLFTMLLFRLRPSVNAEDAAPLAPRAANRGALTEPIIALVDGDPDELAEAGRFEEALAALLLRALRAVGWKPSGRLRGLTAREVLSGLGVDHPGREPLAGVVRTQERVAFGGESANRERYDEARRWFTSLAARSGHESEI